MQYYNWILIGIRELINVYLVIPLGVCWHAFNIFEMVGKIDIGWWFDGSSFEPFLKIGFSRVQFTIEVLWWVVFWRTYPIILYCWRNWIILCCFWVEFSVKNSLSLHAISWESVITESFILNWSGNNFEDLCVLFRTDLICCPNNFESFIISYWRSIMASLRFSYERLC